MLQACLNGDRRAWGVPGVPETPASLARAAEGARAAGAGTLHLHPRNAAGDESPAPADVAALAGADHGLPVLLHGYGESAWPMIRLAAALWLDTRAGLEDMTDLPDGRAAPDNAAIVADAKALLAA